MAKRTRDGYYRRNRFWYTRDPRSGRVVSTECESLAAARAKKDGWELEASNPRAHALGSETVGACCDRLIASREALGKATLFHEQKFRPWVRMLGAGTLLATVGPEAFDRFVSVRRAAGVSDHTIGKEVSAFIRAMRLSKRLGLYAGDLTILRPLDLRIGYVPRTRALSLEELGSLLRVLDPARHAFVALAVALGVRRGELMRLRPEDFDLAAGFVRVRGTKTAGAARTIPIAAPLRGLVVAAVAHVPIVEWGNYLRDLKAACVRAGIAAVTANDLRRTHATVLRSAKVDRDTVRRLLGHSPGSKMLETVYDQPTPGELGARIGDDHASLTRQVEEVVLVSMRACSDLNRGPAAPEALSREPKSSISRGFLTVGGHGNGRERVADDTSTRHSGLAWSLAFAAERMGLGVAS